MFGFWMHTRGDCAHESSDSISSLQLERHDGESQVIMEDQCRTTLLHDGLASLRMSSRVCLRHPQAGQMQHCQWSSGTLCAASVNLAS